MKSCNGLRGKAMFEILIATTAHFLPGDWNEVHPGIRYESEPFVAAAFHNSEGNLSVALGLIARRDIGAFSGFCEAGATTGYAYADVVPFLRCGLEQGRFRAFVAPAATVGGDIGAVVGLEMVLIRF